MFIKKVSKSVKLCKYKSAKYCKKKRFIIIIILQIIYYFRAKKKYKRKIKLFIFIIFSFLSY